ncbi:hypothetical protein QE152_g29020 [Popillia japonica]|uniref:Reverse transcriptase n=1 Tax=Popillia japonica TaxID=7064 RepID=A0AAW1JKN4_POPJA
MGVVPGKKQLYAHTKSLFYVGGGAIPQLSPVDFFKYLGQRYNLSGQVRPSLELLKSQLARIEAAPLKPAQKASLVRDYLLPRLLSHLQSLRMTKKALKDADRRVRMSIRKVLHMNRTSPDAFIHAPIREGGLGIISLQVHVPAIMRARMTRLIATADPVTAAVLTIPAVEKLYQKLLRWTEGNGGSTSTNIMKEWGRKLQESYSGNGLYQGNNSGISGSWVRNPPPFWSGGDYIKAVLLKGNLLPTKGIPSNPPHERMCRAGCRKTESLSHVLQGCPLTHWNRIRRHDRIVGRLRHLAEHWNRIRRHDRIVGRLRHLAENKGWIVEEEQRLRLADGSLRKPDLILAKGDTVAVCDVTVAWEGPTPLDIAYNQKVAYYSQRLVLEEVQKLYPGRNAVVLALTTKKSRTTASDWSWKRFKSYTQDVTPWSSLSCDFCPVL